MSLSPIHTVDIIECLENFVADIRPKDEETRKKLDIGYKIEGQSIFLYTIRPQWNKPEIIHEYNFAKATYVKSSGKWKIYWMRGNLKWYSYGPCPVVQNVSDFVRVVRDDKHSCFFG